jgi:hypothetical protein
MHVIPDDAGWWRSLNIFYQAMKAGNQSVTWSEDEAGIGDLSDITAVLWDIALDKQPEMIAWYDTYYPGVLVEFRS